MDTVINDIPEKYNKNKEWNKNNNPKTAIKKFINLKNYKSKFIIDKFYENKLLITNCPSGFIKKIK